MDGQHADDDRDDLLRRDRLRRAPGPSTASTASRAATRSSCTSSTTRRPPGTRHRTNILVHVVCRWHKHGVRRPTDDAQLLPGGCAVRRPPLLMLSVGAAARLPRQALSGYGLAAGARRRSPFAGGGLLMSYRLSAPTGRFVFVFVSSLVAACRRRAPPAPGPRAGRPRPRRPPASAAPAAPRAPRTTGTRRRPTARPASMCPSCRATSCSATPISRAAFAFPWTTSFTAPGAGNSLTGGSTSPSATRATTVTRRCATAR